MNKKLAAGASIIVGKEIVVPKTKKQEINKNLLPIVKHNTIPFSLPCTYPRYASIFKVTSTNSRGDIVVTGKLMTEKEKDDYIKHMKSKNFTCEVETILEKTNI